MRRCRNDAHGFGSPPVPCGGDLDSAAAARRRAISSLPIRIPPAASESLIGPERNREALARCIDEAEQLPGVWPADCQMLRAGLNARTLNVLFVGQRRESTSRVINALLGAPVLAFAGAATKRAVTHVRFGPKIAASVELFGQSGSGSVAFKVGGESASQIGFRGLGHLKRIVVEHPAGLLASGVRFIETPPVGSLYEYNRHIAHRYVPYVDAIVFVCSIDRAVTRPEMEFLEGLRSYAEKTLCLIEEPEACQSHRRRVRRAGAQRRIARAVGAGVPIYAVSSEFALASKVDRNIGFPTDAAFAAFEQALRTCLVERRSERREDAVAEGLGRILSHAASRIGFELAALSASHEQLMRLKTALHTATEMLGKARRGAEATLRADAAVLLHEEIEPALVRFKGEQRRRARLPGTLKKRIRDWGSPAAQGAFEHPALRAAFAGWYFREERVVSRTFEALSGRFLMDVQKAVDALVQSVGECYRGATPSINRGIVAPSELRWRSVGRYALWQKPTTLRLRWMLCDGAYPRVVHADRSMTTDGSSVAARIEQHARRMRRDFEWRVERSVEEACDDAVRRTHSTVSSFQDALERAENLREHHATQIASRFRELTGLLGAVESLQDRAQSLVPASAGPDSGELLRTSSQER